MSKIFLIDVDGVAGALIEYTLAKLARQFKATTLPIPEDIKEHQDFFKRGRTPLSAEQLLAAQKLMQSSRYVQNLTLVPGAQTGIRAIKKAGHPVIWVTAPWLSSKTWDYDRRFWLQKNFRAQQTHVIMAHQKQLVRGDVFIDDKPQNVLDWRAANPKGRALLYDQPWNKRSAPPADEAPFERFTWNQTSTLLKELADA